MAACAEGLSVLHSASIDLEVRDHDAETIPLRHPEHYRYRLDLPEIAELWRCGSVVRLWLLDLTASALSADPDLAEFKGHVSDSGEGRWTRGHGDFASRVLSAMRMAFGGHREWAAR